MADTTPEPLEPEFLEPAAEDDPLPEPEPFTPDPGLGGQPPVEPPAPGNGGGAGEG